MLLTQRRRRKKIAISERRRPIRPGAANEEWSMDFVLHRVASGRMIRCFVIVDDDTNDSVAIDLEHTICGIT